MAVAISDDVPRADRRVKIANEPTIMQLTKVNLQECLRRTMESIGANENIPNQKKNELREQRYIVELAIDDEIICKQLKESLSTKLIIFQQEAYMKNFLLLEENEGFYMIPADKEETNRVIENNRNMTCKICHDNERKDCIVKNIFCNCRDEEKDTFIHIGCQIQQVRFSNNNHCGACQQRFPHPNKFNYLRDSFLYSGGFMFSEYELMNLFIYQIYRMGWEFNIRECETVMNTFYPGYENYPTDVIPNVAPQPEPIPENNPIFAVGAAHAAFINQDGDDDEEEDEDANNRVDENGNDDRHQ